MRDIYNNEGLREKLREKGIENLILYGSGYETLSLVPDPKHNESGSWMGIGRMFYGNVKTYEYSDHPVTEKNGRLVFDDGLGNKRDLAGYLVEGYPDLTIKQIKRKVA